MKSRSEEAWEERGKSVRGLSQEDDMGMEQWGI